MTKNELLKRLTDIEWDDFEVKSAVGGLPKNIWETVSAFANCSGGWIVLGVSQSGKKFEIEGVKNPEKLEQDFVTVLRSKNKFNVLIAPKCCKYNIEGKILLAFFISSSETKPVYFNSLINTFIRTGSGDQRATESEINALLRDQLFGVMSARPVERTTLDDLNRTTLFRYRDYMARMNPSMIYNAMPESEFLARLQIVEGEHLTYGGLLFMGKILAINQTFPDFRVDLLEVPGRSYAEATTRYTFRLEEQENLWEYYFAIIERLKRQVDMPFKMNDMGFAYEDSPQFNAIREALVNMLMHADYFSTMRPRVRVFTNRIEFGNPGAFPLPVSEFLKKDISLPRNPVLAKLFRSVKLAENAGLGFDKMLKWEVETNTKIEFDATLDMSILTFFLPAKIEDTEDIYAITEKKDTPKITKGDEVPNEVTEKVTDEVTDKVTEKVPNRVPDEVTEKVPDRVPDKVPDHLTDNQKSIINFIFQDNKISMNELSEKIGISKRKILDNINKLRGMALLERIGNNRTGYWKINTKDNQ